MGRSLYDALPEVRMIYEHANDVLGYSISDICFNGPPEVLQDTNNAQPALLVTEIAHLTALGLLKKPDLGHPIFVAGHSLGEYSALVASMVLSFDDALRLVAERGRLMQNVGEQIGKPTGMSAVLGLEDSDVAALCQEAGVDLANLNAPGQVVISGPIEALDLAASLAKTRGARRVMPLQVSAAFHSRWMRPMSAEFGRSIEAVSMSDPRIPVVANVTARPVASGADVKHLLQEQTYSPVRWVETVQFMASEGVTTFIEVGPGKVLSGLIKRCVPDARLLSSEDLLA